VKKQAKKGAARHPAKPAPRTKAPLIAAKAAPAAPTKQSPTAKAPPVAARAPEPPVAVRPVEAMLDDAVGPLRRLLGDLLEERLEAAARDLSAIRCELDVGAELNSVRARLDDLLAQLGAVRFTAEPMDVVDPLIHTIVEERAVQGVPAGVIVEAVRPGFRSGRGLVLCRAAVVVSGG
jgi:hypothetical protein